MPEILYCLPNGDCSLSSSGFNELKLESFESPRNQCARSTTAKFDARFSQKVLIVMIGKSLMPFDVSWGWTSYFVQFEIRVAFVRCGT